MILQSECMLLHPLTNMLTRNDDGLDDPTVLLGWSKHGSILITDALPKIRQFSTKQRRDGVTLRLDELRVQIVPLDQSLAKGFELGEGLGAAAISQNKANVPAVLMAPSA